MIYCFFYIWECFRTDMSFFATCFFFHSCYGSSFQVMKIWQLSHISRRSGMHRLCISSTKPGVYRTVLILNSSFEEHLRSWRNVAQRPNRVVGDGYGTVRKQRVFVDNCRHLLKALTQNLTVPFFHKICCMTCNVGVKVI